MATELPASQARHIIHAAAGAWAGTSPSSFKYVFGTWSCPDANATPGLADYGVIDNYTLNTIGDVSNLKEGGGSTMATVVIDPGREFSATLLHAMGDPSKPSPRLGGLIRLRRLFDVDPVAGRAFSGVASGAGGKPRFTVASTTGYTVGELVSVTGTYVGVYAVLSVDSPTQITLDTTFGITSAGTLSAPASTVQVLTKAVVTSMSVKWEKNGWRMLDVKAEARDSMQLGTTYAAKVDELGSVKQVIYDGT